MVHLIQIHNKTYRVYENIHFKQLDENLIINKLMNNAMDIRELNAYTACLYHVHAVYSLTRNPPHTFKDKL
jgi:hypothetical protein